MNIIKKKTPKYYKPILASSKIYMQIPFEIELNVGSFKVQFINFLTSKSSRYSITKLNVKNIL